MMRAFCGSSFFISHPTGGLGGGEMKKSFWDSGALRCWPVGGVTGVCFPKYILILWPIIISPSSSPRTLTASSSDSKEQTILAKDLRGDQETRRAELPIMLRKPWRWSGRKISASLRLVMRRVFVGGDGAMSGGMEERSNDRFDLDDLFDDVQELGSYSLKKPAVGDVGDAGADVLSAILKEGYYI
jgi:hypothetical protein